MITVPRSNVSESDSDSEVFPKNFVKKKTKFLSSDSDSDTAVTAAPVAKVTKSQQKATASGFLCRFCDAKINTSANLRIHVLDHIKNLIDQRYGN